MRIKMKLLSDTIFGDGNSIPGGEDISVQHDGKGFPLYKGSSFKGIFREELERFISWNQDMEASKVEKLLGKPGDEDMLTEKLEFSDFRLSENVRDIIHAQIGDDTELVLDSLTNLRTFTAMNENGVVKTGSLRMARCVNQGLVFYSEIKCEKDDEELVSQVLPLIKWIGSMRNRGFGKVKIEIVEESGVK